VVIEIVVDADEAYLVGRSLRAVTLDYRLLPVAFAGRDLATAAARRLQVGDRLTVVAELPDLERLIRRQPVPAAASVVVDAYPATAKEGLAMIIRTNRACSTEEASAALDGSPFTLATGLTRGEAEELLSQIAREKVTARVVLPEPGARPPLDAPG
jgi:hypothetical protein